MNYINIYNKDKKSIQLSSTMYLIEMINELVGNTIEIGNSLYGVNVCLKMKDGSYKMNLGGPALPSRFIDNLNKEFSLQMDSKLSRCINGLWVIKFKEDPDFKEVKPKVEEVIVYEEKDKEVIETTSRKGSKEVDPISEGSKGNTNKESVVEVPTKLDLPEGFEMPEWRVVLTTKGWTKSKLQIVADELGIVVSGRSFKDLKTNLMDKINNKYNVEK